MRYVKMFESFQEDFMMEKIFSKFVEENESLLESLFLNEADEEIADWDEEPADKELTKGEKAALAKNQQVMTDAQLAALYLAALGKSEDQIEKYISLIDGMLDFAEMDSKQNPKITIAALADAIGMVSSRTLARTVNKFTNLIDGVGETETEAIYPKLMKAYTKFKPLTPDVIANIAGETLQDPENRTNRDKLESASVKGKEAKKAADKLMADRGEAVYTLFKGYLAGLRENADKKAAEAKKAGQTVKPFVIDDATVEKGVNMAVNNIAKRYEMDAARVKKAYEFYLNKNKILSKLNFK